MNKPLKILFKGPFGSHLYGTNTATSDYDYKAIYQPNINDLITGKSIPETIQDKNNVDGEIYSIHKFLLLGLKGNTPIFDLLMMSPDKYDITSNAWDYIVDNRAKFYSKKMIKFIGYARQQAFHYSDKNDRLYALNSVLDYLNSVNNEDELDIHVKKITSLYDGIGKYVRIKQPLQEKKHENFLIVMDADIQFNTKVDVAKKTFESRIKRFTSSRVDGSLGKLDYKAMSHAYRVSVQLNHLLIDGMYSYPLPETKTIMAIKTGRLSNEEIVKLVEMTIDETSEKVMNSWLPDEPDSEFWDDFLIKLYKGHFDLNYPKHIHSKIETRIF